MIFNNFNIARTFNIEILLIEIYSKNPKILNIKDICIPICGRTIQKSNIWN